MKSFHPHLSPARACFVGIFCAALGTTFTSVAQATGSTFIEPVWAYTDFGPPGKITRKTTDEQTGEMRITFENNATLILKTPPKSAFGTLGSAFPETGKYEITVYVGEGRLVEPKDKPGLAHLAEEAFMRGGLKKNSAKDLARFFQERTGGSRYFKIMPSAFVFCTSSAKNDLLFELQLLAARITDGTCEQASFDTALDLLKKQHVASDGADMLQALVVTNVKIPRYLAGGDTRFGLPEAGEVLARTRDEVRDWMTKSLASGPLAVEIAANADPDPLVDAVARTLGALPSRTPPAPMDSDLRKITMPRGPCTRKFAETHGSKSDLTDVVIVWPATDGLDPRNTQIMLRLVAIIHQILNRKSPVPVETGCVASETYPGFGYIFAKTRVNKRRASSEAIRLRLRVGEIAESGPPNVPAENFRNFETANRFLETAPIGGSRNMHPFPFESPPGVRALTDAALVTRIDMIDYAQRHLTTSNAITIIMELENGF